MAYDEEQRRLLQVVEQSQRMSRARDAQISQLQNENELTQDKCKQVINLTGMHKCIFVVGIRLLNCMHVAT